MLINLEMRTLNTYILRSFLVTLGMGLGIMTFVLLSGTICKSDVLNMFINGVSPMVLVKFAWYMLPYALCYTLPLALLVSTVLVFSRLSADNEIVAMKAMGIGMWQIVTPAIIISGLCCALCLWLFLFVAPRVRDKAVGLTMSATTETPLAMLEPGMFKNIAANCYVKIGAKEGEELKDVHIILTDKKGRNYQDVVAASGKIVLNPGDDVPVLYLSNVELTHFSLDEHPEPTTISSYSIGAMQMPLEINASRNKRKLSSKRQYMDFGMLCAQIAMRRSEGEDPTPLLVELHERLAIGMTPFSFLLLGLPFGIRSKRSELSIGLLICVLLALFFYCFKLLTGTLSEKPGAQYIIWIPNLLYQIGGLYMMRKLEFRG